MTGYLGKTSNLDQEVIGTQAQSEREDMFGPMPGVIVSYDAARGVANVQPLFKKRRWDGSDLDLPELIDVPVDFPRSANAALTFPVPAGTRVQLIPQMRSAEEYDVNDDGAQSDARSWNLSDMRATLVGGDSLAEPLAGVDSENVHLRANADGTFGIKMSPQGEFKIDGKEGNLYELIAEFMELVASDELLITYGSSAGTGHQLFNRDALLAIAAKVRAMQL